MADHGFVQRDPRPLGVGSGPTGCLVRHCTEPAEIDWPERIDDLDQIVVAKICQPHHDLLLHLAAVPIPVRWTALGWRG